MPAVTSRIGGTPTRRIAEFPAMPTTKGSCSVPSPRSPVSGPVAGRAAKGMRFRVRTFHAQVACSYGLRRDSEFDRSWLPEVRPKQSPQSAEISVRAPFLQFFPCSPSVTRSVLFPRPAALRCSASFATANALRVWVSNNKFPAQHARGCGPADEISCRSLRRKHISALGAGHLTSLRARVSRVKSGQKPTWRKSSWHSTKTASA